MKRETVDCLEKSESRSLSLSYDRRQLFLYAWIRTANPSPQDKYFKIHITETEWS